MTSEQRQQVAALFEQALESDPDNVPAWLASATDDPTVRAEVQSLLEHDRRAGAFLSRPAVELIPELADDEQTLTPGVTIGPYKIDREVGRGGMGRVFRAYDTRLGRAVAIKAIAPRLTRDSAQRERLRREARAAAALSHPGVCGVYALEDVDDHLFIVSEFVDGETLRAEIDAHQRPAASRVVETARELSAAIAAAHARGIVHGDLTPSNVMRAADGMLKVLDFGLARPIASMTSTSQVALPKPGTLIGTPAYMAPEQLTGKAADPRTDVFALGVMLYEYATGVHPFAAASAVALLARILEAAPAPLDRLRPDLPPSLRRTIERALQKDPGQRFESAAEMSAALARGDGDVRHSSSRRWWKIHQAVSIGMYIAAAMAAWNAKEVHQGPITAAAFIAVGVLAAIAGILRGHLLFTERVHARRIDVERRRTGRTQLAVDLALAAALFAGGTTAAQNHPVAGVLTMALAAAIALAAALIEPSTTDEAFAPNP